MNGSVLCLGRGLSSSSFSDVCRVTSHVRPPGPAAATSPGPGVGHMEYLLSIYEQFSIVFRGTLSEVGLNCDEGTQMHV